MDLSEWRIFGDFQRLRNVGGTSFDDYNEGWINLINEKMGGYQDFKCIVKWCEKKAEVGAHVEIYDDQGSKGVGLVHMCREHNGKQENLGVVDKRGGYIAFLMPEWRGGAILTAEWMFRNGENDITVRGVRYILTRNDLFIRFMNGDVGDLKIDFHRV